LHLILAQTFILFVIATFLLSRQFARDPRWHSLARPSLVVAFVVLAAALALAVLGITHPDLNGVLQRVYSVTALVWLFMVASGLRSVSASSTGTVK
jgi:hypothetical protein